jgi:hypothetical protein
MTYAQAIRRTMCCASHVIMATLRNCCGYFVHSTNVCSGEANCAFNRACRSGHFDVVKLLVCKFKLTSADVGNEPLLASYEMKNPELTLWLINEMLTINEVVADNDAAMSSAPTDEIVDALYQVYTQNDAMPSEEIALDKYNEALARARYRGTYY